jgi:hypothetical protein
MTISLGCWALADSKGRRQPIPMLARPWFFLLAALLIPGYVIWSRGWRGVGWVLLHGIGWYALATIVMNVGGMVIFGEGWRHGHELPQ